jgi:hypothetical protein
VELFDGQSRLDAVFADDQGVWSFMTAELTETAHVFTVTATDSAANVSVASLALTVTVDATAPTKPVIDALTNDAETSVTGATTDDNTLHLAGSADAGTKVYLYDGATAAGSATSDGTGRWGIDTLALVDGLRTFTVRAVDAAGNQSAASEAVSTTVDTGAPLPPVFTSFALDSGEDAFDGITKDDQLVLSGEAEAESVVKVYLGETLVAQTTAAGGLWNVTTGTLTDGTYAFSATATDAGGNTSVLSAGYSVTVDLTAPVQPVIDAFSVNSGDSLDTETNDSDLLLSGQAEAGTRVALYDGATSLGSVVATQTGWSLKTGELDDGVHHFTVVATDLAGNASLASELLSVKTDTLAPSGTTIEAFADNSGSDSDRLTNDPTPTFSGKAEAGAKVELFEGVTLVGFVTADAQGDWSIAVSELSDGVHTFTATATDTAANTGAASDGFTVEVDTAAPAAPVILSFSEDSGVESDALTNDAELTLTGSADPGTVVDLYEGATLLGRADADGTGAWSVTTSVLVDGKHTFTAKATDAAANTGGVSTAFEVTIDTAAPTKPSITAFAENSGSTSDRLTDDATVTLSGSAEPLS